MTTDKQEPIAEESLRDAIQIMCLGRARATEIGITRLLDAALLQAKQEEMEQCCKYVCPDCEAGLPIVNRIYHKYGGRQIDCLASEIRLRSEGES